MVEKSLPNAELAQLAQETLAKGASFKFKAKGFSMAPFIKDQDVLTISPAGKGGVGIGQAAALLRPQSGKLLVHRVIWRAKQGCLIKADNGCAADGIFPETQIIGQVTKIERNGKDVVFGLGMEKHLISFLSVTGILCHLLKGLRFFRKSISFK